MKKLDFFLVKSKDVVLSGQWQPYVVLFCLFIHAFIEIFIGSLRFDLKP